MQKLESEPPQPHDIQTQPGGGGASPTPAYVRAAELSKKIKTQLEMQGEICSFGSKVDGNFTAPSLLTGQQVVKFQASIDFTCRCKICELQMAKANGSSTTPREKKWALYSNPREASSFCRLVEQLISPTSEIESCTCLITDSVFISEDGKPQLFVKTDRDGKLAALHNKLSVQDIRTRIPDVVKQRREEHRHVLDVLTQ